MQPGKNLQKRPALAKLRNANAVVAQSVEQRPRNAQVTGSSPVNGSRTRKPSLIGKASVFIHWFSYTGLPADRLRHLDRLSPAHLGGKGLYVNVCATDDYTHPFSPQPVQ
jgi:hypothetical protein